MSSSSIVFEPYAPLPVPFSKKPGAKLILPEQASKFWKTHSAIASKKGIYVFAALTGGGYIPLYVGKATKSFEQEALNNDKLLKFNAALADYKVFWKPYLFLLIHPTQKGGPVNTRAIDQLESYIIEQGVIRNPKLQNKIKRGKQPRWRIKGYNTGQGKANKYETIFRKLMGL